MVLEPSPKERALQYFWEGPKVGTLVWVDTSSDSTYGWLRGIHWMRSQGDYESLVAVGDGSYHLREYPRSEVYPASDIRPEDEGLIRRFRRSNPTINVHTYGGRQ